MLGSGVDKDVYPAGSYLQDGPDLNIWHVPSLAGGAPNGMPVGMMIADIEVAISDWFQRR